MRIIAGRLKSRQFRSPSGHRSHPMSEKMRGALFNALGDVEGLRVLDAFAGSGAVAFEAVSRGATAVALDSSTAAIRAMKDNVEALGIQDRCKVTRANSSTWSDNNRDLRFDVVICDPPYDQIRPDILQKLTRHLLPGGLYVLSWPGHEEPLDFDDLTKVTTSNFGDSQLLFFRKS
jgi:16S rRNA (guanine966-N2)-methyltransferase